MSGCAPWRGSRAVAVPHSVGTCRNHGHFGLRGCVAKLGRRRPTAGQRAARSTARPTSWPPSVTTSSRNTVAPAVRASVDGAPEAEALAPAARDGVGVGHRGERGVAVPAQFDPVPQAERRPQRRDGIHRPAPPRGNDVSGWLTRSVARSRPEPNSVDVRRSGAGGTSGRANSAARNTSIAPAATPAHAWRWSRRHRRHARVTNPATAANAPAQRRLAGAEAEESRAARRSRRRTR